VAGLSAAAEEEVTIEALIDITSDREAIRRAGWTGRDETKRINMVGAPVWQDRKSGKTGYRSAVVDGVTIYPGDFVTVRYGYALDIDLCLADTSCSPGVDEQNPASKNKRGEALTPAASIWFAQIVYLFEDNEGFGAHMHWLFHGGDTILGETAGPRELFLIDRCDDAPLGSVAGRIEVHFTGRDNFTGRSGAGVHELDYNAVNQYFYRLSYSETYQSFVEAQDLCSMQKDTNYCKCCEMMAAECSSMSIFTTEKPQDGELGAIMDSVTYKGITYTLNDFVYLVPERQGEVYAIAQIMEIQRKGLANWVRPIKSQSTDVIMKGQVFTRYDTLLDPYLKEFEHGNGHAQRDCRRLYRENSQSVTFCLDQLDGKCIVRHIDVIENLEEYKDLDDTFYIEDQMAGCAKKFANNGRRRLAELKQLDVHDLRQPTDSDLQVAIELSRTHAFMAEGQKLRAMDVFSGCGGLTAGLEQSGAIVTEWAVEWDTAASQTFKRNFPSAKVYNHDANVMLQQAIEEHLGASQPLKDLTGQRLCTMPKPGEVEFIYGGCPCQDFSVSLSKMRTCDSTNNHKVL
jgi:C-5 cytosine-specific DNA methylase/BAH domain